MTTPASKVMGIIEPPKPDNASPTPSVPTRHSLVSIATLNQGATDGETTLVATEREERVPVNTQLGKLETIYRIDGQVFGIVNRFVRDIACVGYTIEGSNPSLVELVKEWIARPEIDFDRILQSAVRDPMVYGRGYFELVYQRDRKDILRVLPIDPKTMDFKRDSQGKIIRDKYGCPKSFVQEKSNLKKENLPIDSIAYFMFYQLGDSPVGTSPIEAIYKPCVYKLNIEEVAGENTYRTGYAPIVATLGTTEEPLPPVEEVEDVKKTLKSLRSDSIVTVPFWVKIERLGMENITGSTDILKYLSDKIDSALGAPRYGDDRNRSDMERLDYEKTIKSLQETLASQVRKQIFVRLISARGYDVPYTEIPIIKFMEVVPQTKLSKARRLGMYLGRGGLTWTPDLENMIRADEGIPPLPDDMTPEDRATRTKAGSKNVKLSDLELEEMG